MERPALLRLLDYMRGGLIDMVVVYKVDRVPRSLADFAKLTELFDETGTSFVSVTQQFNTSTSMGRLTLNLLLSFAQFEREVAGERIRDKIALSKRRGMWMGGLAPLGYDGIDRKLAVNETEAATARLFFHRYLEFGSIAALKRSLDIEEIVSKRRVFADSHAVGGNPLSRGAPYQILRNRFYRGEIAHRGEVHPGKHDAIIDADLWQNVQNNLAGRARRTHGARNGTRSTALLAGLVFDTEGNRMSPTHASKAGRRYRHYISAPLVRSGNTSKGIRVPAPDLDALVIDAVADDDAQRLAQTIEAAARFLTAMESDNARVLKAGSWLGLVERIDVANDNVTIHLDRSALGAALKNVDGVAASDLRMADAPLIITCRTRLQRCGKQVRLILGTVETDVAMLDADLITLVRDGRRWFDDLRTGSTCSIAAIARCNRQDVAHVSRTISLAFLAPDIIEMILAGRQPIGLTPERLRAARPLPLDWNPQRLILLD